MPTPNLQDNFPDLRPITKAPFLYTINLCGLMLYGKRDFDEATNTYVTTHTFVIFLFPIFACGAYRVEKYGDGWNFLGKVPLSGLAKFWNLVLATVLATGIGMFAWNEHTQSPEYIAGQDVERAEQALAANDVRGALQLLSSVASGPTSHAQAAQVIINQCVSSLPEQQKPDEVIRYIYKYAHVVVNEKLLERSIEQTIEKHKGQNPVMALAILDALPEKQKTDVRAKQRTELLETLHVKEPQNVRWASELAIIAERANDLEKCDALLTPFSASLGEDEGARILGSIRVSQGKIEDAYTLLNGYCKARLPKLKQTDDNYNKLYEKISNNAFDALKKGDAGDAWYTKYDKADEVTQEKMVAEWMSAKLNKNVELKNAEKELSAYSGVISVALDLGIITLQRAQSLEGDKRQEGLKDAENIFLSIRGSIGQTDDFKLFYGQVCWWLGRQQDGQKEFNGLLTKNYRDSKSLMNVANALRDLGASGEARALLEEAYTNEKESDIKKAIARQRANCQIGPEDQIKWLSLSDTTNPVVNASLAYARGNLAFSRGDLETAVKEMRICLQAYKDQPRSTSALNNGALAASVIFDAIGDKEAFNEATQMMEDAVALNPSDPILLSNLANQLYQAGIMEIIGDKIDQIALHRPGNFNLFGYCYETNEQRTEFMKAISTNPLIKRALTYYDRLQVIYPRDTGAWNRINTYNDFLQDKEALETLRDRLAKADIDQSSHKEYYNHYQSGEQDDNIIKESHADIVRMKKLLSSAPLKTTKAAARVFIISSYLQLENYGEPVNYDEVISLAEQAVNESPTLRVKSYLTNVLLARAANAYAKNNPSFAAQCETFKRSIDKVTLFILALRSQPQLKNNPDVIKAAAIITELDGQFATATSLREWAFLDAIKHAQAGHIAQRFKDNGIEKIRREIAVKLDPYDGLEACNAYWWACINGEQNPAAATKPWRERGIKLPDL